MHSLANLVLLALTARAAVVGGKYGLSARDGPTPGFAFDPATTEYCSFWYDNTEGSVACEDMPEKLGITAEQWKRWNPSIAKSCANFVINKSYCVEVEGEPVVTSSSSSTISIPPTTTTTTTTAKPTSTKPSNGISTPAPSQPDMVDNCNKFYLVQKGDSCAAILKNNNLSLKDFTTWNPSVGPTCTGLWLDTYACISVIGYTPTPTQPGNGIATPTPIQPGMVNNCDKFDKINKGDSCAAIAKRNGIPVDDFVKWNTQVGGVACTGLWLDSYVCVRVVGYVPTKPTLPGIVGNCNNLYPAVVGDTCERIVSKFGSFSLGEFYKWNPAVKNDCSGLLAGYYYCVGVPMAFHLKTRYHNDCTGDVHNEVTIIDNNDGICINTNCAVGSVNIASVGSCPGKQVQLSYWEKPGCGGKWFGYGYSSRGTCHKMWSGGWKFQSLYLRCANEKDDCVKKGTCGYDPEPAKGICQ